MEYEGKGTSGALISGSSSRIEYQEGGAKTETETEITDGVKTVSVTKTDELGRTVSEVSTVGGEEESSSSIVYDGFGRTAKETVKEDGQVSVTAYTYDKNGRVLSENTVLTSDAGETDEVNITHAYDEAGREVKLTETTNGETESYTTRYTYEDVSVFDTEKGRKTYRNAAAVRVTDDEGHVVSESYTAPSGLLVREKEEGVYTDYVYDDFGTNTAVYTAGADPSNDKGMLAISVTDEEGRVTDIVSNPEKTSAGYKAGEKSVVSSASYDAAGRVKTGKIGRAHV